MQEITDLSFSQSLLRNAAHAVDNSLRTWSGEPADRHKAARVQSDFSSLVRDLDRYLGDVEKALKALEQRADQAREDALMTVARACREVAAEQ